MVRSNEFVGRTLAEAVRKATAVYARRMPCEYKNQTRCNDLLREISFLQTEAGRLADSAERLGTDADRLKRSAVVALTVSAVSTLTLFGATLRGFARGLRILGRKRPHDLSRDDIIDLLAALSPIAPLIAAIDAIQNLQEAERLVREAEVLERNSERLAEGLMGAIRDYERLGCGAVGGVGT